MFSKLNKSIAITSDRELSDLANQLNIDINCIIDYRDINSRLHSNKTYLILLRKGPGIGHWTAAHNGYYFDSMGVPPPSILGFDEYSDVQYQGTYNEYCGIWCLLWIYSKQKRRPELLRGFIDLDLEIYTD